ncbi:hypothetical protein OIU78_018278 [Salix suchowensis]|nr:hypothetical protein OIU78_018278 [Salix suchowensis]
MTSVHCSYFSTQLLVSMLLLLSLAGDLRSTCNSHGFIRTFAVIFLMQ